MAEMTPSGPHSALFRWEKFTKSQHSFLLDFLWLNCPWALLLTLCFGLFSSLLFFLFFFSLFSLKLFEFSAAHCFLNEPCDTSNISTDPEDPDRKCVFTVIPGSFCWNPQEEPVFSFVWSLPSQSSPPQKQHLGLCWLLLPLQINLFSLPTQSIKYFLSTVSWRISLTWKHN